MVKKMGEKSGQSYDLATMAIFSNFINAMNLLDLPISGGCFTWSNNRDPPSMCRLDRFLLSCELLEIMPSLFQKVLPKLLSDHNPVLLCTDKNNWGPKPFRLFSYWMDDP